MKARTDGFTLLELLVAMTLMGLVMVLALGGLRFGAAAWEAGTSATARMVELQTVQTLLRRLIGSAYQISAGTDRNGEARIGFRGDGQSLSFVGPAPVLAMERGLYVHGIRLAEDGGVRSLVLDWRRFSPDAAERGLEGTGEIEVLVSAVERIEIDYFGFESRGGRAWQAVWDHDAERPDLVRINLGFASSDPRVWPPLIVAIPGAAQ